MIKTDKEELIIGLIGDTHIRSKGQEVLDFIINDFQEKKIDYLIHVGDFTSHKTYQYFHDIFGQEKVIAIAGNMDEREISSTLPDKIELELFGYKVFITHGSGGPNDIIKRINERFDLSKYDIIIFGHAHRPFNEKRKDRKLYISPGSPTDKKFTNINSYGYLKITQDKVEPEIIVI
jgi:putative phosphoesterase